MPKYFSRLQVFYKVSFVWRSYFRIFVVVIYETFSQDQCRWRALVVLEMHRKLTWGSSFCNVGACKTQIYLKSLRRTSGKSQLFKFTNKGKPSLMIFSLTCNLLKMGAYSNDFQKIFLARIAASMFWTIFIFNESERYQRPDIKDNGPDTS